MNSFNFSFLFFVFVLKLISIQIQSISTAPQTFDPLLRIEIVNLPNLNLWMPMMVVLDCRLTDHTIIAPNQIDLRAVPNHFYEILRYFLSDRPMRFDEIKLRYKTYISILPLEIQNLFQTKQVPCRTEHVLHRSNDLSNSEENNNAEESDLEELNLKDPNFSFAKAIRMIARKLNTMIEIKFKTLQESLQMDLDQFKRKNSISILRRDPNGLTTMMVRNREFVPNRYDKKNEFNSEEKMNLHFDINNSLRNTDTRRVEVYDNERNNNNNNNNNNRENSNNYSENFLAIFNRIDWNNFRSQNILLIIIAFYSVLDVNKI
ncbi:hypothetical protein QR98_0065290 [Sarcoptes scabiei]|uniref:Uncharacterized protein n=1 Tax=Sarcoptes scabiei TaxID=52283 RepID=A0A132AAK4_SARSC|nr:hypothetical protein QR98_0065290 [Sarcoptes scabiei]